MQFLQRQRHCIQLERQMQEVQRRVCHTSSEGLGTLYPARRQVSPRMEMTSCCFLRWDRHGDKIVLQGEGDQVPDQEPGDIIFNLVQTEHEIFQRSGNDLEAVIYVTLAEALCGFSRVVIKHLDGRGLQIQHPQPIARVLEPDQVIKIVGEGMLHKKRDLKGDLYLTVKIKFPERSWLEQNQAISKLQELLPKPETAIKVDVVDEVTYDETASLDDFGNGAEGDESWEDEEDDQGGPQCAQQ